MGKKEEMMKARNFIVKEKGFCIGIGKKKVEKNKKSQIIYKGMEKYILLSLPIYKLLIFRTNNLEKVY